VALTIPQLAARLRTLRERLERTAVNGQVKALSAVLVRAERRLAQELTMFRGLTTQNGHLVRSVANIQHAGNVTARAEKAIRAELVKPGYEWADGMVAAMAVAGEQLARANLRVPWISQDQVNAVFDHVPRDVGAVLRVGQENAYTIMETVGADVQDWFRTTLLDGIVEELPLQGAGSLAERIASSGRINPLTIRIKSGPRAGQTLTRSIATRANAIARVESAKVMEAVHEALASAALGDEAVYMNDNPLDDRTTDICREASEQDPMTLEEWSASPWGRPPRLDPFHLCRSVLIGGRPEWFGDTVQANRKFAEETRPGKR
jgi:hypothetical protein